MYQPQPQAATLIQVFKVNNLYKVALVEASQKYNIKQYKVNNLTPKEVLQIYETIIQKHYSSNHHCSEDVWYGNQLRIFIWFLVCYSYFKQKCISQLTHPDWILLSKIFNGRKLDFLEFQARLILKLKGKSKKWLQHETQLLTQIIKQNPYKNGWNCISRELFLFSGRKYFKSPKQCREHWINYLDPMIKKYEWGIDQDIKLVACVGKIGAKWAQVSKLFNGTRTENMVKNRFKSLYRKYNKNSGDQTFCPQIISLISNELSKHRFDEQIGCFDLQNCERCEFAQQNESLGNENNSIGCLKEFANFNTNLSFCGPSSNEFIELAEISFNQNDHSVLETQIKWE